ncbi:MAG: hypothetical protein OEY33_03980 [Bdellovibrionales bacterium]|jgi:Flp pilus assembly pilin Flp|nr:hypothetical protein [Bdellovibrionales bacterium]
MNKLRRMLKSERGQTAVEYIMLLAVMTVLATSILTRFKNWILAPCEINSNSIICMFEKIVGGTDFIYFTLRK